MCLDKDCGSEYLQLVHVQIFKNLSGGNGSDLGETFLETFREEYEKLKSLVSRTFLHGEGNSAFLVSPRGGGKSTLVECVLRDLEKETSVGVIIRLNGLLQTDDRLALIEITRQLQMDADEVLKFQSFADNLAHILQTLKAGTREETKPILFILDELDLFCHHHNQTLLYNLFDIVQSAKSPICVLGLTTRLDVIELLEKRVKSRFSHRHIFLLPDRTFDQYLEVATELLKVDSSKINIKKDQERRWNSHIDEITSDEEFENLLKRQYQLSRDIRSLKNLLLVVVSRLNDGRPWLTKDVVVESRVVLWQDPKLSVIKDLSILQLCLIVAMKHLLKSYDGEPFNFEMVYHEYAKFCRRYSQMTSFERPVVYKAFDQLEGLEIVRPVDTSRGAIQRDYRLMQLMITPTQVEEAVCSMSHVPTFLSHWCTAGL